MMGVALIGFFLCWLDIWVLKNSRDYFSEKPVLSMWIALLLAIISFIPVINFLVALLTLIWTGIAYLTIDLCWKTGKNDSKLRSFLTKKIS